MQLDSIQRAEKDLTHQNALELDTAMEAVAQDSKDMKNFSAFSHTKNQGIHWNTSKDWNKKYSLADSITSRKE